MDGSGRSFWEQKYHLCRCHLLPTLTMSSVPPGHSSALPHPQQSFLVRQRPYQSLRRSPLPSRPGVVPAPLPVVSAQYRSEEDHLLQNHQRPLISRPVTQQQLVHRAGCLYNDLVVFPTRQVYHLIRRQSGHRGCSFRQRIRRPPHSFETEPTDHHQRAELTGRARNLPLIPKLTQRARAPVV